MRNVIASAVSSQSNPYASVAPISEAVEKVLGNSPVAAAVSSIAVDVAALPTELHQRFSLFHKRFCFVFVSLVDCSYIIPYEVPNVNTFFKLF